MPVDIQKVLVCDAVDQSCVDLLKLQGISVDYKLKLPKSELIAEAKVRNDKVKVELGITTVCEIFWFRIFVSHKLKCIELLLHRRQKRRDSRHNNIY